MDCPICGYDELHVIRHRLEERGRGLECRMELGCMVCNTMFVSYRDINPLDDLEVIE